MTNWTAARYMTDEERAEELPCFVQHDDAGGRCGRPANTSVYGLAFCEEHGAEVSQGAIMEERYEAANFFERFINPHVPSLPAAIDGEFKTLIERYNLGAHNDSDYRTTLLAAYPETPEKVRQEVDSWKRDEEPGPYTVQDLLQDSLRTMHRLLRIAYEEGETWLVEQLEIMRQADAARCAYAMRSEETRLHSV